MDNILNKAVTRTVDMILNKEVTRTVDIILNKAVIRTEDRRRLDWIVIRTVTRSLN